MKSALIVIGGFLAIVILVLVVVGLSAVGAYNGLVGKSQATDASWAQVQNVYQRRSDLIPNLVQTVQGAASFEKGTLVEVAQARASVGRMTINSNQAPQTDEQLAQFQQAQGQLGNALSRLMVVSEKYPELKSNANFQDLQRQLSETEDGITSVRASFNTVVQDYDTAVKSFPTVLFASVMGFQPKPYFQAEQTSQVAPAVKFDFK
jgi:LemA protein